MNYNMSRSGLSFDVGGNLTMNSDGSLGYKIGDHFSLNQDGNLDILI